MTALSKRDAHRRLGASPRKLPVETLGGRYDLNDVQKEKT